MNNKTKHKAIAHQKMLDGLLLKKGGTMTRDEMLGVVNLLHSIAFDTMERKSAARGISNLSDQGFAGICTRALSDKAARINTAIKIQSLVDLSEDIGYPLDCTRLPVVEWDKVFLDMLDISNYMMVAAYMLLRDKLNCSLPIDDD